MISTLGNIATKKEISMSEWHGQAITISDNMLTRFKFKYFLKKTLTLTQKNISKRN